MTYHWVALLIAGTVAGCGSYRSVGSPPAPGGGARATYAAPRDVRASAAGGSTLLLPRIEQLEGSVVSARGDTVVLALTRTRPSYALSRPPAAPTVVVVRAADVKLEALRFDPDRTAGLVLGVSAAAALVLLVAFIVGMQGAYGS